MEDIFKFKIVCRNLRNHYPYQYLGDNKWKNMATGVSGLIDPEKARERFKINLEVTQLVNEYPEVERLINVLGLRIENY